MLLRPLSPDEALDSDLAALGRHLATTDPAGCWVAQADDGSLTGVVLSSRRDELWSVAALRVSPDAPVPGLGAELLTRAAAHGGGALYAAAVVDGRSSAELLLLRAAGLRLHPTMRLQGVLDEGPLDERVRARPGRTGSARRGDPASDRDLVDGVDLLVRGARRGADVDLLAASAALVVAETDSGRGYAFVGPTGVETLSATDGATASAVLSAALDLWRERAAPGSVVTVGALTAAQDWAVVVGAAHGLSVVHDGFLCLRGHVPPRWHLPHRRLL